MERSSTPPVCSSPSRAYTQRLLTGACLISSDAQNKQGQGGIASKCSHVTTALPIGKGQCEMRRREELSLDNPDAGVSFAKKMFITKAIKSFPEGEDRFVSCSVA